MRPDLVALLNYRSDPDARTVLEDADAGAGTRRVRLGLALWFIHADSDADDDGAAATDGATDGASDEDEATADAADTADTGDDGASDGASDEDEATVDAATAVAAAATGDDGAAEAEAEAEATAATAADLSTPLTRLLSKEPDMRNGLKIIQVPGRYGWAVTRIGWLRRVSGDEWELLGARSIVRTGLPRTLDSLASDGPGRDHRLSELAKVPEEVHRLVIRRSLPADPKAWAAHCPRPAGWRDDD